MPPPFESKFEALNFLDVRSLLRGCFLFVGNCVCFALGLYCVGVECEIINVRFCAEGGGSGKVIGNSEE